MYTEQTQKIQFNKQYNINYGLGLFVIGQLKFKYKGNHPLLGQWDIKNSFRLNYDLIDGWHGEIDLPLNYRYEYKFAISEWDEQNRNWVEWEQGPNNILDLISKKYDSQNFSLNVMSFNICHQNQVNNWQIRKNLVIKILIDSQCDIIGLQEVLPVQKDDIIKGLMYDYNYFGRGRYQDGSNEQCGILYNQTLFEFMNGGHFWLSNSPEYESKFETSAFPRIVTWIKLKHLDNKRIIFVFNTHFDHWDSQSRVESSIVLLKQIQIVIGYDLIDLNLPYLVIITGDFNDFNQNQPILALKQLLNCSSDNLENQLITYHNWLGDKYKNILKLNDYQIDYIFHSKNTLSKDFQIIKLANISKNRQVQYPSDHYPIKTQITLNSNNQLILSL